MPAAHPAAWPEEELLRNCEFTFTRRRGPGGQHRNKVETAVVVTFVPAGVQAEASERRSQLQNRQEAIRRLRLKLARHVRSTGTGAGPSPLWRERLAGRRLAVSPQHADYPALLAEALDALYESELQPAVAAERLECSTSQLLRLIQRNAAAWQQVNEDRVRRGLPPLHARQ